MHYDVAVVGGGFAGVEAAAAAARMGATTLLITPDLGTLAHYPNSARVGGTAPRSILVREIDALGGLMGRAADQSALHHRPTTKPQSLSDPVLRVVVAPCAFSAAVRALLADLPPLTRNLGVVSGLSLPSAGDEPFLLHLADGQTLEATCVVLTVGTMLAATAHRGASRWGYGPGRRAIGTTLAATLAAQGFTVSRHKTSCGPTLDAGTIDLAALRRIDSAAAPLAFGLGPVALSPGLACWEAVLTDEGLRHIHTARPQTPRFTARGPAFCPSIEHRIDTPNPGPIRIALEPQSPDGRLLGVQGFDTSLPLAVQQAVLATLPGCARVRLRRSGHAVTYAVLPGAVDTALAVRGHERLFLAGQITGTSGYEEAAAQGLWAGLHAAARATGVHLPALPASAVGALVSQVAQFSPSQPPTRLRPADLLPTMRGATAHMRLMGWAITMGLRPARDAAQLAAHRRDVATAAHLLDTLLTPSAATNAALAQAGIAPLRRPTTVRSLLRRPDLNFTMVAHALQLPSCSIAALRSAWADAPAARSCATSA